MFLISSVAFLSSLFIFLPCPFLSSPISFLPFSGRRQNDPQRIDMSLNPNTINSFIFFFLPCPSLSSITISSISLLPSSGRWHKMAHKGWCVVKPQHNQKLIFCLCYGYSLYRSLDKSGYQVNSFLIAPQKTYVVGTHLIEARWRLRCF